LLLDAGGAFAAVGDSRKITGYVVLSVMSLMEYDAVNLGPTELAFGTKYLEEEASNIPLPFVSTNAANGDRACFINKVLIKDTGDARVAILGVTPHNDALKTGSDPKDTEDARVAIQSVTADSGALKTGSGLKEEEKIEILPPIEALKESMSEITGISDFVILLSQLPQDQNRALLNEVKGIDLVISCQASKQGTVFTHAKTPSVMITPGGTELGYIKMEKDEEGRPARIIEDKKIILGESVPIDEDMAAQVDKIHRKKIREERVLAQKRIIEQEAAKLRGLSPMQYLERLQEDNE
jgi:2',3'-cyclic-nucleotide 2'-phosphodiesterase (5'-nucleotidase family)